MLQGERLGEAAGLVQLDADGIVAVAQFGEVTGDGRFFVGTDDSLAFDCGKQSVLAGRQGCSTSAMPASAEMCRCRDRLDQPSLASRMIAAFGAAARTARMRLSSSEVPTLTFSRARWVRCPAPVPPSSRLKEIV